MSDYYSTLCVPKTASAEEIKAAYRRLSRATHPDHGGSAAAFAPIAEAYACLSDPEKRREYDQMGQAGGIDWGALLGKIFGTQAPAAEPLGQALAQIARDAAEANKNAGEVANLVDIIRECGDGGVDYGLSPAFDERGEPAEDGDIIRLRAGLVALGDWFRGGAGKSPLEEQPKKPRSRGRTRT